MDKFQAGSLRLDPAEAAMAPAAAQHVGQRQHAEESSADCHCPRRAAELLQMREALRPLKACSLRPKLSLLGEGRHECERNCACPCSRMPDMASCPAQVGALVFYGRKRYARILNAYLERNLARDGGVLHEVLSLLPCTAC